MKLLSVFPENPNERFIDMAVDALANGKIIIYLPTHYTHWVATH